MLRLVKHLAAGLGIALILMVAVPEDPAVAQIGYQTGTTITGYTDGGVPAAGASGDIWQFDATLNAMDGGPDTTAGLVVGITNADHTGTNILYGIEVENITPDANALEYAYKMPATGSGGWDADIFDEDEMIISLDTQKTVCVRQDNNSDGICFNTTGEITFDAAERAISGASQNINPQSFVIEVSAASAADVITITPPGVGMSEMFTFICEDSNLTFTDADAAGAINTINTAGAATDFTCSEDDSITFAYKADPANGNARWVEVARSVN